MKGNEIAKQIMDAAFHIHRTIRPGLVKTVYEVILTLRMQTRADKRDLLQDVFYPGGMLSKTEGK